MIFKANLNVILVVFKSSWSPLEILIGVCQHRVGRGTCPHLFGICCCPALLHVGQLNFLQLLTLLLFFTVLISNSLLNESKFLMAQCIPVSL